MKKIIIILCLILLCSCSKAFVDVECEELIKKDYTIHFHTLTDETIDDLKVCSDCAEYHNSELAKPEREGYIFMGWYYDSSYLMKFKGTHSEDITLSYITDDYGCPIGYNDIDLYALWIQK